MSWRDYVQWASNAWDAAKYIDKNVRFSSNGGWFPQELKFGARRIFEDEKIPFVKKMIGAPPSFDRYAGPGSVQRPNYRAKKGGVKTLTKQKKKKSNKGQTTLAKLKREQYLMKKQLRQLPPNPKDLHLDLISDRWSSAQGLCMWQDLNVQSKNSLVPSLAGGPTNVVYALKSIPGIDTINSFTKGRSKYVRHEWAVDSRMTNISNCPIELECYTLKARKRVPVNNDTDSGLTTQDTFFTMLKQFFFNQFGVNTATNPQYGPTHPAFKLTDLKSFNEFFKIVKMVRNVVQPGEAMLLKKWGKKARTFDSSGQYNASVATTTDYSVHYEKGDLLYVYRQLGIPQSQASVTATSVTLCDTVMDVVHSLRLRIAVIPYATYDALSAPGQLATGQTIKLIFPGTSAAGTAAPAT